MDAGTNLETERGDGTLDAERAANRACRPVEHREEAVPGRIDLLAGETLELGAHGCVMLLHET